MAKTLGYIRISTAGQETNNQKYEILEYARTRGLQIDDYIEVVMSSRKSNSERRIDELLERLTEGDTLVITELSRLGRSTSSVIALVNKLISKKVRLISIKQNLDIQQHDMSSKIVITLFSLLSELERDLISSRTRESLAAKKANGTKLGKRVGTIQKSRYDKDADRIKELLKLGLSVRKIAKILNIPNHISLNEYVNKRQLR